MERIYQGIIIDDEEDISLVRLCNICDHSQDEIIEMVEEGIVEPRGRSKREWRFSFTSVERVKRIKRLKRDFDLNTAGVGLAIHLLDRIEELEALLKRYEEL
ncbi:MAG: chaperone modulator CbpM [Bacteroidales bacterium]|nr:chaperone modulator CbpM [Bacteroidales bacterium]